MRYAFMYSNDARANVLSPLDASLEVEDISLGILAGTRGGVGEGIREGVAGRVALRENAREQHGPVLVALDPREVDSALSVKKQLDELSPKVAVWPILLLDTFASSLRVERLQGLRSLDDLRDVVPIDDNVARINGCFDVEPAWKVLDGVDNCVEFG